MPKSSSAKLVRQEEHQPEKECPRPAIEDVQVEVGETSVSERSAHGQVACTIFSTSSDVQHTETMDPKQDAESDMLRSENDAQFGSECPQSKGSRRHRGPRPSPGKLKRDAARADAHRALSEMQGVSTVSVVASATEAALSVHSSSSFGPLDSIAENVAGRRGVVDMKKLAEKDRLRRRQEEERASSAVCMSTVTTKVAGDALKAEALHLEVGNACLLEDAKLVISEQAGIYGLVGPNGCGKTTLVRVIADKYAPECRLPIPKAWGPPFLVDQLDPEPTGQSPVEEVLSGCKERTTLLDEHRTITEKLVCFDEQLSSGEDLCDADQRELQNLTDQITEIDEQLARWDSAEKDVTRILVGLGFHDGEVAADGVPSLRAKNELVTRSSDLKVNDVVEVRDNVEEEWLRGIVTSIDPLMVQPDGFTETFMWTEVRHSRELSGGWRKKVSLAKALWMKPKLLLLDEPTNHLDFDALLWLEEELKAYPHTVVIVSHNACFLSAVCNKVLQITEKRIKTIPMADLTLESLAAMQRSDEKHRKFRDWRFAFPSGDKPEMHGLSFHNVSFSYSPESPPVLRDIHRDVVRFHGRSRTVIFGRNGSGKSTLLKLCLGIVEPTQGEVDVSCELRHFSQHFNEALDRYPEHVAASYLVDCCRLGLKKRFRHTDEKRLLEGACEVLSWFGLGKREAVKVSIKDLSGGQKARLNFAFLSLCPAHLLILDEPTNHLDANGLEHLADALTCFEGGVVLVSHDELLIRRVLASSEHSELLVCSAGSIYQQTGVKGLDAYRRAAFRAQHLKAEAASQAAEKRIQASRQERRERPRGRRRACMSEASTREPTPDVEPMRQPDLVQPPAAERMSLDAYFKSRAKKKTKPVNSVAQPK